MRNKQLWVGVILIFLMLIFGFALVHATLNWLNTLNGAVAAACVTAVIGLVGLWYMRALNALFDARSVQVQAQRQRVDKQAHCAICTFAGMHASEQHGAKND
jgi:uncharacterized membrane protein